MAGLASDAATIHLGRMLPSASRNPPGRLARKLTAELSPGTPSLFGLAPGGVYRAAPVTSRAVGSYPTLSPLPRHPFRPCSPEQGVASLFRLLRRNGRRGGLLSVALSLGSPPPGVTRHRVSLEPGLSSPAAFRHMTSAAARPTDTAYKFASARKSNKKAGSKTATGFSFTSNGLKLYATADANSGANSKSDA